MARDDEFDSERILQDLFDTERARDQAPAPDADGLTMLDLLHAMVERGASDLHVKVGSPPGLRVDGAIRPLTSSVLTGRETVALAREILTDEQFETFGAQGDLDLSYDVPRLARFRVNVLTQRGTVALVVRRVPRKIATIDELGLPPVTRYLAERPRGLVLVTGATGSGKSTTLAALVHHVNTHRRGHIVTLEDPIEHLHEDKRCWVTQREIGADSKDFPSALRRVLRQDPDVIMVGEMRDLETISLAVTAAETGHLVFATLHTTTAIQTANRIVDVFPAAQQAQVRAQLADNLQGIVCQALLPRAKDGGRVAALEVLVATDAVRALLRDGKTPQIRNLMQTGAREGMLTLESSLNYLVKSRQITVETAKAHANYPDQIAAPRAAPA